MSERCYPISKDLAWMIINRLDCPIIGSNEGGHTYLASKSEEPGERILIAYDSDIDEYDILVEEKGNLDALRDQSDS